jgi:hypothetical protein
MPSSIKILTVAESALTVTIQEVKNWKYLTTQNPDEQVVYHSAPR